MICTERIAKGFILIVAAVSLGFNAAASEINVRAYQNSMKDTEQLQNLLEESKMDFEEISLKQLPMLDKINNLENEIAQLNKKADSADGADKEKIKNELALSKKLLFENKKEFLDQNLGQLKIMEKKAAENLVRSNKVMRKVFKNKEREQVLLDSYIAGDSSPPVILAALSAHVNMYHRKISTIYLGAMRMKSAVTLEEISKALGTITNVFSGGDFDFEIKDPISIINDTMADSTVSGSSDNAYNDELTHLLSDKN